MHKYIPATNISLEQNFCYIGPNPSACYIEPRIHMRPALDRTRGNNSDESLQGRKTEDCWEQGLGVLYTDIEEVLKISECVVEDVI